MPRMLLRQITNAVPGTISVYDFAAQRIIYINRKQFMRLIYTEQALEEMNTLRWIEKIAHPDDKQKMRKHICEMSVTADN